MSTEVRSTDSVVVMLEVLYPGLPFFREVSIIFYTLHFRLLSFTGYRICTVLGSQECPHRLINLPL
jgi:hypothetical protein